MEEDYFNKMKDFRDQAADYFTVVGKNEKDLMTNTKNYMQR